MIRSSTSDPQVDDVLTALVDTLAQDLVGAYLHGSAVHKGLRPQSDIDILAVSARTLSDDDKRALVGRLLTISGRRGRGRPVEVTVVAHSDVRPWRFPPRVDLQYGEWLRDDFERDAVGAWQARLNPDLAAVITMTLLANEVLFGPPAAEVFDPVPLADFVTATAGDVDRLLDDLDADTRNGVLTLARIWSTLATNVIRPKDEAASWALDRLPPEHQPVLRWARAAYLGHDDGVPPDVAATSSAAARRMADEIGALADGARTSPSAGSLELAP